jgi:hypothetical protein
MQTEFSEVKFMSDIDNPSSASPAQADVESVRVGSLVSRRRLVRAGMAAAPVAMALTSQSVLAADVCIRASAFSSLKAANYQLSGGRTPTTSFSCFSHGYWKNHTHPGIFSNQAKSFFLNPHPTGTGNVDAGFTRNPGSAYTGLTIQAVLSITGNANDAQFARDILATFLTAVDKGDVNVLLTQSECRAIWNNNGVWTPPGASSPWNKTQTIAYLQYVYSGVPV